MLREIIIPRKRDYLIEIPSEYLNKKVEILVLPIGNEFTMESVSDNTDIILKTAGMLKKRKIDPVAWQRSIRAEWDDRQQ